MLGGMGTRLRRGAATAESLITGSATAITPGIGSDCGTRLMIPAAAVGGAMKNVAIADVGMNILVNVTMNGAASGLKSIMAVGASTPRAFDCQAGVSKLGHRAY